MPEYFLRLRLNMPTESTTMCTHRQNQQKTHLHDVAEALEHLGVDIDGGRGLELALHNGACHIKHPRGSLNREE